MELVERYIGQWGRFQAGLYALFCLPFAISAMQVMAFSFTGAVPAHRCFLPGWDNETNPEYRAFLQNGYANQIYPEPTFERGKLAYCFYCPGALNESNGFTGNCHRNDQVGCTHGHIYDRSQYATTMAATFGMVCDDGMWKRSLASSFYMLGFLVGAAVSGSLSDRYGRRPVFLFLSYLRIISYFLIIFTPNTVVLCVFHLFSGAFTHGSCITGFVIVMEYIGGMYRTITGIWFQGVFAVGYMYVGLCAYFIREWKLLQLTLSLPSLLMIPSCWLAPESVRWLITHGRKSEAKELILKGARWNKLKISESELERDIENEVINENAAAIDLFKNRSLAKVTLIVFYSWLATSMLYYGLSLNSSDLPGNEYGVYILMGFIELPGFAIAVPMMEKWGRRPTCVVFFGFGGVAVVIGSLLPKSIPWLITCLASIGKMGAAASFAVIYNYSAELFPTVARNAGVGYASSCARVSSICAPLIYLLAQYSKPWVPFFIYGAVSILAALLDMFLPETRGRQLPETLQDGARLAEDASLGESLRSFACCGTEAKTQYKKGIASFTTNDRIAT